MQTQNKQNTQNKKFARGFTLLELLVVVIIIGILAAIALPQYRKVVLKSKLSTAKTNVKTIYQGVQRYYLVNNSFPDSISELDVEVKGSYGSYYYYTAEGNVGGIVLNGDNKLLNYFIDKKGKTSCISYDTTLSGNSEGLRALLTTICQQETNKKNKDFGGNQYSAYEY